MTSKKDTSNRGHVASIATVHTPNSAACMKAMGGIALPVALRRFLFVLAVGALVSSGIYLQTFIAKDAGLWNGMRALAFFLVGVLFALMYGENKVLERTGQRSSGRSRWHSLPSTLEFSRSEAEHSRAAMERAAHESLPILRL